MRAVLLVLVLAGCAPSPPVDPVKLASAPKWALQSCPDLPPIPKDDGDPAVRAEHYGVVRGQYEDCRDRQRALAGYARKVTASPVSP